jgi:hypothetical protein
VVGYCECGNDPSGSIKCGVFRDKSGDVLASLEGPQIIQLYKSAVLSSE